MKLPHRRVTLLVALLTAASLVMTSRLGGATWPTLPIRYPDNPPGDMYGDPEIPDNGPRAVRLPVVWQDPIFGVRVQITISITPGGLGSSKPARVVRQPTSGLKR